MKIFEFLKEGITGAFFIAKLFFSCFAILFLMPNKADKAMVPFLFNNLFRILCFMNIMFYVCCC